MEQDANWIKQARRKISQVKVFTKLQKCLENKRKCVIFKGVHNFYAFSTYRESVKKTVRKYVGKQEARIWAIEITYLPYVVTKRKRDRRKIRTLWKY